MTIPDTEDLLDGINRWAAIESKTDDRDGIARMMATAEADFRAAGLVTETIPGRAAASGTIWLRARPGAAMVRVFWCSAISTRCTRPGRWPPTRCAPRATGPMDPAYTT